MELPSIHTYGNYASPNHGVHALRVHVFGLTLWFSYETLVAFCPLEGLRVVRQNAWGCTTGKHLGWIDGGSAEAHKARVSSAEFERAFGAALLTPAPGVPSEVPQ